MTDKDILQFIYDRMINHGEESPNYEYMQKFKAIIDNTNPKQITYY